MIQVLNALRGTFKTIAQGDLSNLYVPRGRAEGQSAVSRSSKSYSFNGDTKK